MKKIEYDKYGGPELMHLDEVEPPVPGKGQVLVRVLAAAANPMDWKFRNGDSRLMTGRRFPRGVGNDFAGTVVAAGEGVTQFKAGDNVLGAASLRKAGAFAEMVTADHKQVVKMPAELSFEQAAALPTVGMAALQALIDKGKLTAGQSVFITGCLGGVGRTVVQSRAHASQTRRAHHRHQCQSVEHGRQDDQEHALAGLPDPGLPVPEQGSRGASPSRRTG